MCDQFIYSLFIASYSIKTKVEGKTEKESNNHWLMVRLNLSFNDVRNFKGIFNLAYKQKLLFEKSKETDKFKASKVRKATIKASKTQIGNKF